MSITLYPVATDLKIFETVWRNGTPARLAPEARDLIKATAAQAVSYTHLRAHET